MPHSGHGRGFFGSLESLRGIAALSVALLHASWVNAVRDAAWVRNSYLMVDLFFVLSGFVICHAYGERIRNRIELRDFFVLRLGRLYPLHVAVLSVWVAIDAVRYGAASSFGDTGSALVSNLLLVHSLGVLDHFTFNAPSWSISTEFYAYAAFAFMVLALGPRLRHWRLPLFVGISAVSLAVLLLVGRTDLNATIDFGWFRCTMGFFLGAASYLMYARACIDRRPALRAVAPYVAAAALAVTGVYLGLKRPGPSDFLFPPLAVILIVSLAASAGSSIDRWLRAPALAYLGKVSYSVYMVHYLLALIFSFVLSKGLGFARVPTLEGYQLVLTDPTTGTIALVLYVGAVLGVAYATFTWIEDRFRRKAKELVVDLHAPQVEVGLAASPVMIAALPEAGKGN
jgi:peptidoglycan/LPS O-acetylase OafA/YrhL